MNSTVQILEGEKKPHTMLTQYPRKRALVLSTPRTGSIFISELIYVHYCATYPRTQHLGEILNPYHFNLFFEGLPDGTKKNHLEWKQGRFMLVPGINKSGSLTWARVPFEEKLEVEPEIDRRVDLVKKLTTTFVLHHHVFTEDLLKKVLEVDYDLIVVCVRRSYWKQILSYGIAFHTKRFKYLPNSEIELGAHSVTLDKRQFDTLVFRIKEMEKVIPLLKDKNAKFVEYEDIQNLDMHEVLTHLGLPSIATASISAVSAKTPYKLDIEQYYDQENLKDITKWYNHEFSVAE